MNRIRWSVVVLLAAMAVGVAAWSRWPSSAPSLDCDPQSITLDEAGIARCDASGAKLPAAQALTARQKLDLNTCTADELARVQGLGREVANRIITARATLGGRFTSWHQIDEVEGVGEVRFNALRAATRFDEPDASPR